MSLIIFDVDGTVADNTHRRHLLEGDKHHWDAFLNPVEVANDTLIPGVKDAVKRITAMGHPLLFLTGRNEGLRTVTEKWIKDNLDIVVDQKTLLMRPIKDMSVPSLYKRSQISKLVYSYKMDSVIAFDDDPYALQMMQELGIMAFKAPEIWATFAYDFSKLEPENNWRV